MRPVRTLFGLTIVLAACGSKGSSSGGTDLGPSNALVAARPYDLNVPRSYDGSKPAPVVVMLHGFGATPFIEEAVYQLTAISEAEGFLYATPSGMHDPMGRPFWNATDACCDELNSGVDDVAYLNAVVDDIEAHYNVDRKRVFFTGHSNGGFMSHRMACDATSRIAAIVSLAGATWKDQTRCTPSQPIAVLEVHGDADDEVPYGGAPGIPSAMETVADWAQKNGCDAPLANDATTLDLDAQVAGSETSVAHHACTQGVAELWTMHGVGHVPNFNHPGWGNAIWGWMKAHARP